MTGPLKFWHVYCCHVYYFFSARFLYMCKLRTTFYLLWRAGPPGLAFYGSGLACLPSWLEMMNAGWLGSMQSEIFLSPPNRLPFYLGRPLHIISSLFSKFCLFQNVILHKMLEARVRFLPEVFWCFQGA